MVTNIVKTEYPKVDLNSIKDLKGLTCFYHKKEDTLFIHSAKPSPATSVDWEGEVWIRVDMNNGKIVGFEIDDFESVFLKKHPEIARAWEESKSTHVRRVRVKKCNDLWGDFYTILYNYLVALFSSHPQQLSLGNSS